MKRLLDFYKGDAPLEIGVEDSFDFHLHRSLLLVVEKESRTLFYFLNSSASIFKVSSASFAGAKKISVFGREKPREMDIEKKRALSRLRGVLDGLCCVVDLTHSLGGLVQQVSIQSNQKFSVKEIRPEIVLCDDSPTFLKVCHHEVTKFSSDTILATLSPFDVVELAEAPSIKLFILDINMPDIKGTKLASILRGSKPILLLSGEIGGDSPDIMKVLQFGRIDFLEKNSVKEEVFKEKVLGLVSSKRIDQLRGKAVGTRKLIKGMKKSSVLVIGISTGGVQTLEAIFKDVKRLSCPVVVIIHMPKQFTGLFTQRLNETYDLEFEHVDGTRPVGDNKVYILEGNSHYQFFSNSGGLHIQKILESKVKGFCPNIDHALLSLAKVKSIDAIAGILTGMGKDGAKGLLAVKESGGLTFSQDEASSIIFGMPKAAADLKASQHILSPSEIVCWFNEAA
jgi:two-component system chemotaxis response regulator CheB